MKVTPLDIRRKEFKRSMRGYSDEEVDIFLDDVADEFERLFQENIEFQDRIQRLEEQLAGHAQLKDALEKTLVSAQLQADQLIANARKEAELILRDAELKARDIVNDSYVETREVQQTLVQLKRLEEEFRFKFRSLLEGHLKLLDDARIAPVSPAAAPDLGAVAGTSTPGEALAPESVGVQVDEVRAEALGEAAAPPSEVQPSDEAAPERAEVEPEVPLVVSDQDEGEETTAEATVETGDDPTQDERNAPTQRFFFGRRLGDEDEDFLASEPPAKDKTRDFEW